MSRLKNFLNSLVIPWIDSRTLPEDNGKPLSDDAVTARLSQPCPYGERFGTELKLALGDGANPIAPFVQDNVNELIFEADIDGIFPDKDIIFNLRLYVDTDKNDHYLSCSLMGRIVADEGDAVLFEEPSTIVSAPSDIDNPRGFIYRVVADYREQQYQEKLSKIKEQLADNELKLYRLF